MDEVSPVVHVRISGKQRYSEPWMMTGIGNFNHHNQRLYKETFKPGCSQEMLNKYKVHRNMLNWVKCKAKTSYYTTKCNEYKYKTKNLWQVINQTIGKKKHKGSIISFISVDDIKTYDPQKIINIFRSFYANLSKDLAKKITLGHKTKNECIGRILRTLNSLVLHPTTQPEVEKLIQSLSNKSSSSHDNVSNNLLKGLCSSISYPLTIIFNQSISQGIFPDIMKMAEVIPLYKEKETDRVINYHPISLLKTILKILEKIVMRESAGS